MFGGQFNGMCDNKHTNGGINICCLNAGNETMNALQGTCYQFLVFFSEVNLAAMTETITTSRPTSTTTSTATITPSHVHNGYLPPLPGSSESSSSPPTETANNPPNNKPPPINLQYEQLMKNYVNEAMKI